MHVFTFKCPFKVNVISFLLACCVSGFLTRLIAQLITY